MGDGRFRFPKTIELEELSVERAVPKSKGINTLNRLLLDMCEAVGIKRKTAHCFRVTGASVYNITVSGEVEKVSRKVDIYSTPVCFEDYNNCAVNVNFKIL